MKFLCEHHRQQLFNEPRRALARWQEWMAQGNARIEQGDWREACRFVGCSFEVSEWLLLQPGATPVTESWRAVERYMLSGHHLAECLGRCGHTDRELDTLLAVHVQLVSWVKRRQPQYWLLKQHLQISLLMLGRFCNERGSFNGYYGCCVEAEWCINQCVN